MIFEDLDRANNVGVVQDFPDLKLFLSGPLPVSNLALGSEPDLRELPLRAQNLQLTGTFLEYAVRLG